MKKMKEKLEQKTVSGARVEEKNEELSCSLKCREEKDSLTPGEKVKEVSGSGGSYQPQNVTLKATGVMECTSKSNISFH